MDTPTRPGSAAITPGRPSENGGHTPLLSIGLPVYNGAKHLREAIDSLLAQDVEDLELVISDNASTDDTPRICAEYAEKDSRVRFTQTDVNIGAAANFNRVFELSGGDYFMWGSDDDIWSPRFARRCIDELDAHPEAVSCTSNVEVIDDASHALSQQYLSMDTKGMPPEERAIALLRRFGWYDVYSVFRPSALRATNLYQPSFGGDVHLLMELVLQGETLVVPETLFRYRIPAELKDASTYLSEISTAEATPEQESQPWGFLARDLLGVVNAADLSPESKSSVREEFESTLSQPESRWGAVILAERGLPSELGLPLWAVKRDLHDALSGPGPSCAASGVAQSLRPWELPPGEHLRWLRRPVLRMVAPFMRRRRWDNARAAALNALGPAPAQAARPEGGR